MKKSKFVEEQIAYALCQVGAILQSRLGKFLDRVIHLS
jgi:hypothetical protein